METLDPQKGYDPNYMIVPRIPKMESYIRIYAFMNLTPERKTFDFVYVNELNATTIICFYGTC